MTAKVSRHSWQENPAVRIIGALAENPKRGKMMRTCKVCGATPGRRCFRWTGKARGVVNGSYQVTLNKPHRQR